MPSRPTRSLILFSLILAAPAAAQAVQDGVSEKPAPPPGSDTLSIAQAASARGDPAEALSQYLRMLAHEPNNVQALAGAGRAALKVGDLNAATGFFARAEELAPNDGTVKAGLASTTVQTGNARAALRYFGQARSLGVADGEIASDRGLAYDLTGEPKRAQAQYLLALKAHPGDPTITRRLALSQAIGGELPASLATLDPLLRKQDVAAWRARAFAKAVAGDVAGAEKDAALVLPPNQVATIRPYLIRLAGMKPADKAAAVFLGRFPEATSHVVVAQAPATRPAAASPVPASAAPATATSSMASRMPAQSQTVAQAAPSSRASAPAQAASVTPSAPVRTTVAEATPARPAPSLPYDLSLAASEKKEAVAEPRPATPPPPTAAERRAAAQAEARAKAAELAKSRAEALAQQKKKAELAKAAEEEKTKKANPARHWVQVAGGANKKDLPRAWDQLKAKWPKQLAGRSPWTLHYRYTNRLLIGPFPTSDAAQDWVTERKKEGLATFRVETNAGDPVDKL